MPPKMDGVEPPDLFADLFERAYPDVFRAVYMLTRDREAAEDATQEAFTRALERWSRLRGRSWAAGWVMTTALNAARREAGRRTRPPPLANRPGPFAEPSLELWDIVRGLPHRQAQVTILRYVVDLSVPQIAEAMGCAQSTVRVHLFRARKVLAAQVDRLGVREHD